MIDGVKIVAQVPCFETWQNSVQVELFSEISKNDNKPKSRIRGSVEIIEHRGTFEHYALKVKEIVPLEGNVTIRAVVEITGSLHKNRHKGENWGSFTFAELVEEVHYLMKSLSLPDSTIIEAYEVGLNIPLPFSPIQFLQGNLLQYGRKDFEAYKPKKGVSIGFTAQQAEYSVKLYDKGLQCHLSFQLMRFEIAFKKVRKSKGIKKLIDLTDAGKVSALLSELHAVWNKILITDDEIDHSKLSEFEIKLLEDASHRHFGRKLQMDSKDRVALTRKISAFKKIIEKHGTRKGDFIAKSITQIWQSLFRDSVTFPSIAKAEVRKTFSNISLLKVKEGNVTDKASSFSDFIVLSKEYGEEHSDVQRSNTASTSKQRFPNTEQNTEQSLGKFARLTKLRSGKIKVDQFEITDNHLLALVHFFETRELPRGPILLEQGCIAYSGDIEPPLRVKRAI